MPVVEHHDKSRQRNLIFLAIETERVTNFRGDNPIDYRDSGLEVLGDKECSGPFHLTVQTETSGVRERLWLCHGGPLLTTAPNRVGSAVLSGDQVGRRRIAARSAPPTFRNPRQRGAAPHGSDIRLLRNDLRDWPVPVFHQPHGALVHNRS